MNSKCTHHDNSSLSSESRSLLPVGILLCITEKGVLGKITLSFNHCEWFSVLISFLVSVIRKACDKTSSGAPEPNAFCIY